MADRYVYSGGSNTSPYDTWAKAATTLATALTVDAAGDNIWIASDHSESTAGSITLSVAGSAATPTRIISVNRAGSAPPVAADILAGAVIATTGANAIATGAGVFYCYGVTFSAGDAASAGSLNIATTINACQVFEGCHFKLANTSSSSRINLGTSSTSIDMIGCTMEFGHASQAIVPDARCSWKWRNKPGSVAITGATVPTTLIVATGAMRDATLSGLDLSALGSGKTLVSVGSNISLINCKLDASVTVAATPSGAVNNSINLIGCGATGNVARNERFQYQGTLTTETTIVRASGASDGVTAYSWKIVTNANNERDFPFECFEGVAWNSGTGSAKTLTVHTVTDNVTLTDAEIWLEVEYLGSSGSPVASLVSDGTATVLTAGANQTASLETWTTTGLTTPVTQELSVSFTPQMAGPVRWKVKVAKASTTVYVCPRAELA